MRKRAFFLLFISLINIMTFTGCWNYREIDKMSIVAGTAIDRAEDGRYKVTIEIIDLHEGGREAKIHSKKLESYGDTLFEAIRNSLKITSNKPYWGHMEIMILSRRIASEGILEIIDFMDRDNEPRLSIDMLMSTEKTAEEILDSQSITTEIRSYEVNKMLDSEKYLSKTPKVELYQFINALSDEGISAVLPTVGLTENDNKQTTKLSGTAVFSQDKLAYTFNEEETRWFLFVINKVRGGSLPIKKDRDQKHVLATIEITKSKTKVKPVYSDGKLSFDIKIKSEATLAELDKDKTISDKKQNEKFEIEADKYLRENVTHFIKEVQKNGIDIFGFGKHVKEDLPDLWRKIQPEWGEFFKKSEINVTAEIEVTNSGLTSESIKIGD